MLFSLSTACFLSCIAFLIVTKVIRMGAAMMECIITTCCVFVLVFAGLQGAQIFHSSVLLPLCTYVPLPFISGSGFCQVISSPIFPQQAGDGPNYQPLPAFCSFPVFGFLDACSTSHQDVLPPVSDFQRLLSTHFKGYQGLVDASQEAPLMVHDIREFGIALTDLVILVGRSDLVHKEAIVEKLKAIKEAGEVSGHQLQAYSARLEATVAM